MRRFRRSAPSDAVARRAPRPDRRAIRAVFAAALLVGSPLTATAQAPTMPGGVCRARTAWTVPTVSAIVVSAAQRHGESPAGRWQGNGASPSLRALGASDAALHGLGSWHLARAGARAASCDGATAPVTAAWQGAAYAVAVGVAKEVADGWYSGFSTADLVANGVGIALAVGQAHAPALAAITPTISVAPSRPANGDAMSAATVWLSASVAEWLPSDGAIAWPQALRVSVGRRTAPGGSALVVGLDLDAGALPGSHPAWVTVKRALHHARLPGPALVIGNGGVQGVGLAW